ncbi:hypothetical protein Clacol_007805 [Clathrus columnatus]|uniref:Cytochrome P450 n=1 Tax=Clathrus columnatus TaxID=1419009 RepID=A0AAV5AL00_9AGAM|nr:hypothetical protein Clacol_007805 [Clathrus columnatus]
MDVVYAIEIKPENDPFINRVHITLEGLMLRFHFPAIPFKRLVKRYREVTKAITEAPFEVVKNRESPDYSFVSTSLEKLNRLQDPLPDEETIIRNTAGTLYSAGAGTTFVALLEAIRASVLYPETQKKMHEELDRVLSDRLPTLADRKDLPYVTAVPGT